MVDVKVVKRFDMKEATFDQRQRSTRPKIEEVNTQRRVEEEYKSVIFRDYMRKRRLEEEAEELENQMFEF